MRRGGRVMAVTVRCRRFIRFPARSARRAEGVTEKYPTAGNYGRLSQLYTPKMSGAPPEIYTYPAYIGAKARPAIVSTHDPLHDHFIYLYIINAHSTLIPMKNERILHLRAASINNFCDATHVALGFIMIVALRLTTYTTAQKYLSTLIFVRTFFIYRIPF